MTRAERLSKGIYWDRSWNPFTGCTPFPECVTVIGEGCRNCWARRMANRLRGRYGYSADEPFRPTFHPERLDQVNSKQKPKVIALCFMSDPFHEEHGLNNIDEMLLAILDCSQHIFIALTKRPERMKEILGTRITDYPLPNLVGGVSVWDQPSADRMIPILLEANLATRIISLEPCLGAVDLGYYLPNALYEGMAKALRYPPAYTLDGIILGGEGGPGARPMQPDWARSIRDQCQAAGVPFFLKSLGKGKGRLLDGRTWDQLPETMK